ncbi:hypothetical protein PTKIN_Ptkin11bG0071700 [Pterospermum kingtungense]
METKPSNPVYEDFELETKWVHEASYDALLAPLPGFRKQQLKIQLTSGGVLKISGERPLGNNKFSRFHKEVTVPSNCEHGQVSAKFEGGVLRIQLPKLITPAKKHEDREKPSENPAPQPVEVPQKQNNGPEQAVHEAPEAPSETKEEVKKPKDVPDQKASDKENMKDKNSDNITAVAAANEANKTYEQIKIFKQVLDSLVMGLKNPRKFMNMVLVLFLVVLLALFVRNWINSGE